MSNGLRGNTKLVRRRSSGKIQTLMYTSTKSILYMKTVLQRGSALRVVRRRRGNVCPNCISYDGAWKRNSVVILLHV